MAPSLLLSLLAVSVVALPSGNAQIDVTSAPDVAVNVTQTPGVVVLSVGRTWEAESFPSIMVPTSPAGAKLAKGSPYDLTFSGIRFGNGTGMVANGTTTVELVNASAPSTFGAGIGPQTANLVGASPAWKDAVFGGIVFPGPGVYILRSAGTNQTVANVFVYPMDDLSVTVSPSNSAYSPTGTLLTVTVSSATGPAAGAYVVSDAPGVPTGITNANGQFSVFTLIPVGSWRMFASYNDTGPQSAVSDGATVSIPERLSNATFTVNNVSAPGAPRLVIGNWSGGVLFPVHAPLRLENASDLGTITVDLAFDPAVVRVENVTPTNANGSTLTWSLNNSAGTLRLLYTSSNVPGSSGSLQLVSLALRAQPTLGNTSALDLTTVEAAHSDGSLFAVTDVDGSFRAGLIGDVNGDDVLSQADATLLAQYVVGSVSPGQLVLGNADANRDGRVSGIDAMYLSQYLAGNRASLG